MNGISKYPKENFSCASEDHSAGHNWNLCNAHQGMQKLQGFPSVRPAFNLNYS